MDDIKVCAIIPLFNEEKSVSQTIEGLLQTNYFDKVVAVDDGSKDKTWEIVNSIDGVKTVRHSKNMGKAEAVYDGINSFDADIYVLVDGDLGYSSVNIYPVIDMVLNNECDMCVAALPEIKNSGGIGFLRWFARYMVKKSTGLDFPCPLSGQRAFKACVIKNKCKMYHGFGLEVGMLIDTLSSGYRVKYVNCNLNHNVTGKDIKGYIHRFKQFTDILKVFYYRVFRLKLNLF